MSGFVGNIKCIEELRRFHRYGDPNDIWLHYYAGISPPSKVIQGENQNVTASNRKCFTYICVFTSIQDIAIKFQDISDYSFLLCENIFNKGPGTIHINSSSKNDIIIDKFCSFESKTPTEGHFTYFEGNINSTILRGSISNGGDRSTFVGMIFQYQGLSTLSKTNISNCVSFWSTAFRYSEATLTTNVSFCNFENLEAGSIINYFSFCDGRIERCNYVNNFQTQWNYGLIFADSKRLDIYDSVFQNTLTVERVPIFYAFGGQLYIYRCNFDEYFASSESSGFVDNSSISTDPFSNDLEFNEFHRVKEIYNIVCPNQRK